MLTTLVGVLAAFFRHDFIYVVSISLVLLVLIKQPAKKRIVFAASGIVCFLVITIISSLFNAYFDIDSKRISSEALSIPLQQTARFVYEHGDEVKPWERDAINAILDYEALPKVYTPGISDPVKGLVTIDNNDDFNAYIKAWFSMLQRRPITYIEATLSNSYAYFTPFSRSSVRPVIYNDHDVSNKNRENYDISFLFFTQSTRHQLYLATIGIPQNLPGINIFYYLGNYTWFLLLLMLGLFINKKYTYLLGFAPALLVILTCIASPVNGYFRYYIPVMMVVPILLAWAIYGLRSYSFSTGSDDPCKDQDTGYYGNKYPEQ